MMIDEATVICSSRDPNMQNHQAGVDITGALAISLDTIEPIANAENPVAFICDTMGAQRLDWTAYKRDGVGVLDMHGPVWSSWDWKMLARGLYALAHDADVRRIVFSVNSPGGLWDGCLSFAKALREVSEGKPVTAQVTGKALSAGYVAATAAESIVVSETAELGCLGTMVSFLDTRRMMADMGVRRLQFISTQTPLKNLDPTTREGAERLQARLDEQTEIMLRNVAEFRGVSLDRVLSDYGAGDVLIGGTAIDAGLADRFGELENLVRDLQTRATSMSIRNLIAGGLYRATAKDEVEAIEAVALDDIKAMPNGAEILQAAEAAAFEAGKAEGIEAGKAAASADVTGTATEEQIKAAAGIERERVLKIQKLAGADEALQKLAAAAIEGGESVEAFSVKLLESVRDRGVSLDSLRGEAPGVVTQPAAGSEQTNDGIWSKALSKMGVVK